MICHIWWRNWILLHFLFSNSDFSSPCLTLPRNSVSRALWGIAREGEAELRGPGSWHPLETFLSIDSWFIETWVGLLPVEKRTRLCLSCQEVHDKLKVNASLCLSSMAERLSLGGSRGMEGMWIFKVILLIQFSLIIIFCCCNEPLRSSIFLKFIFNEKSQASSLRAHSKTPVRLLKGCLSKFQCWWMKHYNDVRTYLTTIWYAWFIYKAS